MGLACIGALLCAICLGSRECFTPKRDTRYLSSRCLIRNQAIDDEIGFITDEMALATGHTIKALELYPDPTNGATTEQNKTGFSVANKTSDTMYTELAKHPERLRRFGNTMRSMTAGVVYDLSHLAAGYDWDTLAKQGATIVDVGGGEGGVSRYLLKHHPGLKFTVQDLPATVEKGRANLTSEEQGSITFAVHDFFTPQTAKADVFFLRWILHNWSDKYCVQIIRDLVAGMKPGSKIVLYEYLLPEVVRPGDRHDYFRR